MSQRSGSAQFDRSGRAPVVLGVLLGIALMWMLVPAAASAAECTDTWTGPAEGGVWSTAGNWSGGVPTETSVACIPAGKTVAATLGSRTGVIQGEGGVEIYSGSLEVVDSGVTSELAFLYIDGWGTLDGEATVAVTSALYWSEGSMSGAGSTVIRPGASATLYSSTLALEGDRQLVNEGSLSLTGIQLHESSAALIENTGIFTFDSQALPGIGGSSTGNGIVNRGTFVKSSGTGFGLIDVPFHNDGFIRASSGDIVLAGGGSGEASGEWEAASGSGFEIQGDWSLDGGVMAGDISIWGNATVVEMEGVELAEAAISLGEASLQTGEEETDLRQLTVGEYGSLHVAGTLVLSAGLTWSSGELWGPGSLVLGPMATSSIELKGSEVGVLKELRLVNEGSLVQSEGRVRQALSTTIVNSGTFTVNSEASSAIENYSGTNLFVNEGTVRKTEGTGSTVIESPFYEDGEIERDSGTLIISDPIKIAASTATPNQACAKAGDPVECATGNFTETQTDFAIGGLGVGLDLTRTYNAQAAAEGATGIFGHGWTNSFGDRLISEEGGAKLTLTDSSGSTTSFTRSGTSYLAPSWSRDKLTGSTEAGFTLTLPDQTEETFSGGGRLESVSDRNGNETLLGYEGSGRLETITDPTGREITLTYNSSGLVESAEDPMGHVIHYT